MSGGDILSALYDRQSVRAYTDEPVGRDTILAILRAAAQSPSGTNTQPWRTYVVAGRTRQALCDAVCRFRDEHPEAESRPEAGEYRYYPDALGEPYLGRRRKIGWDLYRVLGVRRGDREASWKVAGRNYTFFGAPVGLIFTLDRGLEKGSWIDLGIFLGAVMMAAHHHGLSTCAQGAWALYHAIVRAQLMIPEDEIIVCGMALGHADRAAPVNAVRAEKLDHAAFARLMLDDGGEALEEVR